MKYLSSDFTFVSFLLIFTPLLIRILIWTVDPGPGADRMRI
jgi:hypothetical protein